LIGVVIAVRDQAAYLGEALDSIAAQTLAPADVVVVDDGSTDGTGEVARERGIRTLTTPGLGTGPARDLGAGALSTPLITFLDGDDRFLPEHHEVLAAALERESVDVVYGMSRQFLDPRAEAELATRFAVDATPQAARQAGTLLMRKARFDAVGGFACDPSLNELLELYARLPEAVCVPVLVHERRIHGANRSIVARDEVNAQYLASARAAILRARREGR
jgi:glycosyltransferase involved in cell wall biosynthesis